MLNSPNTNTKAQVLISSLAHKDSVSFFPYDFEFDDSYKPEWGTYEGFGRMDPIMTYKRTTRDVTLSFNVVAESVSSAATNFENLQKLIKFLYPIYQGVPYQTAPKTPTPTPTTAAAPPPGEVDIDFGAATVTPASTPTPPEPQKAQAAIAAGTQTYTAGVIQKSPLFTISFMNLLQSQKFVAAITGFKHKMNFNVGGSSLSANGFAIPGEFNISISFKVLHTAIPGMSTNYTL